MKQMLSPVSVLLSFALLGMITGCKSRSFNASTKSTPSVAKMLEDDPAHPVTMEPLQNYSEDMVSNNGGQMRGPKDPTTGADIDANVLTKPRIYLSTYVRTTARKDSIDQPFAAATVLETMRLMRETYAVRTPTQDRSTAYSEMETLEKYKWVGEPGGTETSCIQNQAPHWSDLMLHYYCTFPYMARGCFTVLVLNMSEGGKPIVPPAEQRKKALELCLSADTPDPKDPNYRNGLQYKKEFQDVYAKNWVTDKTTGQKVNIFNYIMLSQTYAFNWEQQQAVLNAFYGDMRLGGTSTFDPSDASECSDYRPRRYIDPTNNYCSVDKTFSQPLAGVGR